eukprot:TRINITY_DN8858_c0_g1_i3.p1 TRINITY_DN8858_c0_g1~~TRINITY_DN8858_c0_g1_i3.p1  ORF type:complete len:213 (-),score=37.02 TRINITY_DN8858_c0_g1_i3:214-852(-)
MKRERCNFYVLEYRNIQEQQATKLYRALMSQVAPEPGKKEQMILFQKLCNFHCALEELWFPFPKRFREQFTSLGYKCLDRSLFLQFVDHGILEVTLRFAKHVLKTLTDTHEDRIFKYLLLSQLPIEEGIALLELDVSSLDKNYRSNFLVEYKLRNQQTNYNSTTDMEKMEKASFLPLEIFLDTVTNNNGMEEEDVAFATRWVSTLYTRVFQY